MRTFWIVFGASAQVLFLAVVVALFRFLWGDLSSNSDFPPSTVYWNLAIDLALLLQFSLVHSLLLYPGVRRRLEPWIPSPLYGCFFCAVTCVGLLTTTACWQTIPLIIFQAPGWAVACVRGLYIASWVALLSSIRLTGLGYQTGWTTWWVWLRKERPPRRGFEIRGAYRVFRHPIYLSFLGLIWFTPTITGDRLLLDLVWTGYIFVGSWLKDERLEFYIGTAYRRYRELAPAYPTTGSLLGLMQGTFAVPRGPIENLAPLNTREAVLPQQSFAMNEIPPQRRAA